MYDSEDAKLFDVLILNSEQPSTMVPSRKVLRIRAIKESFKVLNYTTQAFRDNSDFGFLRDQIKYYAAS